jgi:hypothetical protein
LYWWPDSKLSLSTHKHMDNSKNYCTVIQLRSSLNGTNMDVKHSYPTWKDCCEHLSYCKVLSVVLHQWRLFWWSALHILEMEDNEEFMEFYCLKKPWNWASIVLRWNFATWKQKKWLCQSYKGLFCTNPTKSP